MDARNLSHRELAERLHVDHTTVTRALGLLKLPTAIQASVDSGEIRPQTAYELSRVEDPVEQAELAEQAKAGRLKRDEMRSRVSRVKPTMKGRGVKAKKVTERVFRTTVGTRVTLENRKGLDGLGAVMALREALLKAEAEISADQVAA